MTAQVRPLPSPRVLHLGKVGMLVCRNCGPTNHVIGRPDGLHCVLCSVMAPRWLAEAAGAH